MQHLSTHVQGLLLATFGALALTPDGLLVRLVAANDWTIMFWRGLFIALCLFMFQALQHKSQFFKKFLPQSWKEWLSVGLCACGSTFFVLGINHTTVANALVILSTMSLFAAMLSMVFLKEYIPRRTWIAMACAIFGIVIVFMDNIDGGGMAGKLFALGCAFVTAAYMTVIRSEKSANVPTIFAWGGLSVATLGFIMAPSLEITVTNGVTFGAMAFLNAVAFTAIGAGAKRIPSPEVSLLMLLETILGPVWVWFILQEAPSQNAMIGGLIVVTTLALHALASLKASKAKA